MAKKLIIVIALVAFFAPMLPLHAEDPASVRLDMTRLHHIYQGWNNCGPATVTMALGYYGYPSQKMADQEPAALYMKPNPEDQNVSFWQMVDYVNEQVQADYGVQAMVRRGGNMSQLKQLVAADFPVIIGKGLEIDGEGWVGHFVFVIGYDDEQSAFLTYDSYKGHGNYEGLPQYYDDVELLWQQFNNVFMVIYPTEREADLHAILGNLWEETAAWEQARDNALARVQADPSDIWAQFNLGETLTALGEYEGAAAAYEVALFGHQQLPWRILWYMQGAFRAYYETGHFRRVEQLAKLVHRNTRYIEDINYYLGLVAAARGEPDHALALFDDVLNFNPNFYPAAEAQALVEAGEFVGPIAQDVGG